MIKKVLCRIFARRNLQRKDKPVIIVLSPGCGRAGSRKTLTLIYNKDLLEEIKNSSNS